MLKYNFLLYLISPFILIKLIIYSLKNSTSLSYIGNKLFGKSLTKSYSIWLHAASVGEMNIAMKVSKLLIEKGYEKGIYTNTQMLEAKLEYSRALFDAKNIMMDYLYSELTLAHLQNNLNVSSLRRINTHLAW